MNNNKMYRRRIVVIGTCIMLLLTCGTSVLSTQEIDISFKEMEIPYDPSSSYEKNRNEELEIQNKRRDSSFSFIEKNDDIYENETEEIDSQNVTILTMTYHFERPTIEYITIDGTEYARISVPDSAAEGSSGDPVLPTRGSIILIPYGKTAYNIEVTTTGKIVLPLNCDVEPASEQYPTTQIIETSYLKPNATIYTSDNPFPENPYTEVGKYYARGYELLVVALHPVQYIPVEKMIYSYSTITISVTVGDADEDNPLYRAKQGDFEAVLRKVDNPGIAELCPELPTRGDSPTVYDLLIITTNELAQGFDPLIAVHEAEGLETIVWTVEDIYNDFSGVDEPEMIRNAIRSAYENLSIEYVLIGGDVDVVPIRYLLSVPCIPDLPCGVPSDVYYSCLDGSYDSEGDGVYGERHDGEGGGDVDYFAEVYIGRASVGNLTEVGYFVNKTIAYMCTEDAYLRNVTMAGECLSNISMTFGGDYLDELIGWCDHHGYYTQGFPTGENGYNITKLYDRDWPGFDLQNPWTTGWPPEVLMGLMNNGTHIINHGGHSGDYVNMKLLARHILNLTNIDYFFVYSWGCDPAALDTLYYDAIAEYYTIKTEHAAFAGIWNTRAGYYCPGGTDSSSHEFMREFWDAVFGENISVYSLANQDSKEDVVSRGLDGGERKVLYQLIYLGDPTLVVKRPGLPDDEIGITSVETFPDHVAPNGTVLVNVSVLNMGKNHARDVELRFKVNESEVETSILPCVRSLTTEQVSISVPIPVPAGIHPITVNVSIPGVIEESYADNEKSVDISVGVLNIVTEELFNTIQEAHDDNDTLDGHHFLIPRGVFHENIVITKNIVLKGADRNTTIIEGKSPTENVLTMCNTCRVDILKMTIQKGRSGIYLESAPNTLLSDIQIIDNSASGIYLSSSDLVMISQCTVMNTSEGDPGGGIYLNNSDYATINYCTIFNNTCGDLGAGIGLISSNNALLTNNDVCSNTRGFLAIEGSSGNYITDTSILHNHEGIVIDAESPGNSIYHNCLNNSVNARDYNGNNIWDEGYPSAGNWWSDYEGYDIYNGPDQNITGSDGIGDTPYNISNGTSQDRYPFMNAPWLTVINMDSGECFEGIQEAIDDTDTDDGHTLLVKTKTYYENIIISKSLSLQSLDMAGTVIDGNGEDLCVWIQADHVTLSGFSIRNANRGIDINSNCNTISDNSFISISYAGIRIFGSRNTIKDNSIQSYSYAGVGIYLDTYFSEKNRITDNIIRGHWSGLSLCHSSFNLIVGNIISDNWVGLILSEGSDYNCIYYNIFNNYDENALDECTNIWDNGYPHGGNYWSDHPWPVDVYHGPDQDLEGPDGIIDTAYVIPKGLICDGPPHPVESHNMDHYPWISTVGPLIADAHGPYRCIVNESYQFIGSVSGGFPEYTWLWDFGDGTSSIEQNPMKQYNRTGLYVVNLTVTDSHCFSFSNITTVTVKDLLADAGGPYSAFLYEPILFSGSAVGGSPPYNWSWDFKDGNTSTEQSPVYSYTEASKYTVTLTVTDSVGNNDTHNAVVTIVPPVVQVDDEYNQSTPGWEYDHFATIQDGINAVAPSGCVIVANGTYKHCIMNKKIQLIGADRNHTIIDGFGNFSVIAITADNVLITGFTIQNTGRDSYERGFNIFTSNNTITNNNIIFNGRAVCLYRAHNNIITDNTISLTNHDALYIRFSENNTVANNIISESQTGIYSQYAHHNRFIGNIIGPGDDGIHLDDETSHTICSNNYISWNYEGIHIEAADHNTLIENTIHSNYNVGISITSSSHNTTMYHNNLIDNFCNAYDDGHNIWNDTYPSGGNFWSDFDEPCEGAWDNDTDGFVDSPYYVEGEDGVDYYPFIIPLNDTISPVIQEVIAVPETQVAGGQILIQCTVLENTLVKQVQVNISGPPNFIPINLTMTRYGDTDTFLIESRFSIVGIYDFYIWAEDKTGNTARSEVYHFEIEPRVTDYIHITETPNGIPLLNRTIGTLFHVPGYASSYNSTYGYLGTISVNWSIETTDSDAQTTPEYGPSSTFYSGTINSSTAIWIADDGNGHTDTITFNITSFPIYVDDDAEPEWYDTTHVHTINESLNIVSPYQTIFVANGTYAENFTISQPINLIGEDPEQAVIDGSGLSGIVYLISGYAHITGFTLQNSDTDTALTVWSDYNIISNNIIMNNKEGIHLSPGRNNTITSNVICMSDIGIKLDDSSTYNRIEGNIIGPDNDYGIKVFSSHNTIFNNTIASNVWEGILLDYYSCHNLVCDNTIGPNQKYGIRVYLSHNNTIMENNISGNNEFGLALYSSCTDNIIRGNTICSNNRYGLYISSSTGNTITDNLIGITTNYGLSLSWSDNNLIRDNELTENNAYGMVIYDSYGNSIYYNNFFNNTQHANDTGINTWDNDYPAGGNYWDGYDGSDERHGPAQNLSGCDGIGDSAYNISEDGGIQDRYPCIVEKGWLNNPPATPRKPTGKRFGMTGREYNYATVTDDPEGYAIYYNFSWGDGTFSGWIGPFVSGESGRASHSWASPGGYYVSVRAKDARGAVSNWSESLWVRIIEAQTVSTEVAEQD